MRVIQFGDETAMTKSAGSAETTSWKVTRGTIASTVALGRDTMLGGAGDDHIFAEDMVRDRAINCGLGMDKVNSSDPIDPLPVQCE
jgi:hypothetical protein